MERAGLLLLPPRAGPALEGPSGQVLGKEAAVHVNHSSPGIPQNRTVYEVATLFKVGTPTRNIHRIHSGLFQNLPWCDQGTGLRVVQSLSGASI